MDQDLDTRRYTALFDRRSVFDALRTTFVNEDKEMFHFHFNEIVEREGSQYLREILHAIWDSLTSDTVSVPLNFAQRAWPVYLQTVATRSSYYFSPEELVLMCYKAGVRLAIFQNVMDSGALIQMRSV